MDQLLNTTKYSMVEIGFFGLAGAAWVVVYAAVIRGMLRNKFVEIPFPAVVVNFGWEIVWGFFFRTDLGLLFAWGYRLWFFMDLFIVWQLFKHGYKQIPSPTLQPYFRPVLAVLIATFTVALYFFVRNGYDSPQGLVSGYFTTIVSSTTYLWLFHSQKNPTLFSETVVWMTVVAIGASGVFAVLALREYPIAIAMCGATWVCNWIYVFAYYRMRREVSAAPVRPAMAAGRA
jgi:hypothetical protein